MIIYCISNNVNNKKYIGITCKSSKQRWDQHKRWALKYNSQYKFHRAIRKYGSAAFVIKQIDTAMNATAALELEVLYVAQFDSYHTGYNSTFGGDHYLDSNWQRENQLKRVSNGTHPFMGGEIQRKSGKKRWVEGTNSLIGLNEKRVATDSHNFQGDNNPTRRLSKLGLHHNQKPSWLNTKANKSTWLLADTIYQKWIETAWSYKKLQTYFNLNSHLGKIISKFRQGWNPTDDPKWIKWKALN